MNPHMKNNDVNATKANLKLPLWCTLVAASLTALVSVSFAIAMFALFSPTDYLDKTFNLLSQNGVINLSKSHIDLFMISH